MTLVNSFQPLTYAPKNSILGVFFLKPLVYIHFEVRVLTLLRFVFTDLGQLG